MIMVQAAGFSDIGKVRKANEDSFLLNEPNGLYVVADGMGGIAAVALPVGLPSKPSTRTSQPRLRKHRVKTEPTHLNRRVRTPSDFAKAFLSPIKESTSNP
jgi:hypothetical protein